MRIRANPMGWKRWWIYQQERFPIVANGVLIGAFSVSAVAYSALSRNAFPGLNSILIAFLVTFLFFLELRIADEFKDFEEDCRFRPYRAVPRGLVSLSELGKLGIVCGCIQLGLSLILDVRLVGVLAIAWGYLGLMSREFFVRDWLKAHPVVYMSSHMMIMPLIYGYATACDWLVMGTGLPGGLSWFLGVSFWNGLMIEIGRKIRAPEDEESGVETYSFLWGRKQAVWVWLGVCLMMAGCGVMAATWIQLMGLVALSLGVFLMMALGVAVGFLKRPKSKRGKWFEGVSALGTLILYLSLGLVPLVLRWFGV